jgi:hypothetical protein
MRGDLRVPHPRQEVESSSQQGAADARAGEHGLGAEPSASGPTTANEIGVKPLETSQSTLFTRPSSSLGTTRCMSVTQMTRPRPQHASAYKAISIACQGSCTTV